MRRKCICTKRCTCHAKRKAHVHEVLRLSHKSSRRHPNTRAVHPSPCEAPSAAPATQNETQVEKVLHLPGKMRHNCTKCCTCHAKQAASSGRQNVHPCPREASSAAPATQNEAQEAPSAAPATQKRRRHPDARAYITAPVRLQVLRLPRKMRRKWRK